MNCFVPSLKNISSDKLILSTRIPDETEIPLGNVSNPCADGYDTKFDISMLKFVAVPTLTHSLKLR